MVGFKTVEPDQQHIVL